MSKFIRSVIFWFLVAALCGCFVSGWFLWVATAVVGGTLLLAWTVVKWVFRLLLKADARAVRGRATIQQDL